MGRSDRHPGDDRDGGPSDRELLRRAGAGDQRAWDALVERYGRLVWHVVRSVGLGERDVADASQLTWLRLVEHLDAIREPDRLAAWLITTAKREALRVSIVAGREAASEADMTRYEGLHTHEVPEEEVLRRILEPEVERHLEQLPPRYREVLRLLSSEEGLSYAEVARRMGMPIGSVGPMRDRSLRLLRQRLGEPA